MTLLDSRTPEGPVAEKWENHKFSMKLVNPNNNRRFEIIVVGTGLAGAAAAASLSELGYLSLIHICRCRRYAVCRSRWSPYH